MPIGSERVGEGLHLGYDAGGTGAEVVHKETTGFVHTLNVNVNGDAFTAGSVFSLRDGTGNVVWQHTVNAAGIQLPSYGFVVILDALFDTDIRTLIVPAGDGHMTVAYQ